MFFYQEKITHAMHILRWLAIIAALVVAMMVVSLFGGISVDASEGQAPTTTTVVGGIGDGGAVVAPKARVVGECGHMVVTLDNNESTEQVEFLIVLGDGREQAESVAADSYREVRIDAPNGELVAEVYVLGNSYKFATGHSLAGAACASTTTTPPTTVVSTSVVKQPLVPTASKGAQPISGSPNYTG